MREQKIVLKRKSVCEHAKSILRLALAETKSHRRSVIYPLTARLTFFLHLHVDTQKLWDKKPSHVRLGIVAQALLDKTKTTFELDSR